MDKVATFRQHLAQLLEEYSQYPPSYGEVLLEKIIDPVHDHYQLMSVGWHKNQRVHGCILHVDIHNGKIWIQHDGTEEGIANRLVELGVAKEDIVLAFHSPYKRQFTEFAVG